MKIPPSGEQYEIAHGERRAVIVEVGGGIREYEPLDGYGLDEQCKSGRGMVLVPWPNRIEGGSYEWEGETRTVKRIDTLLNNQHFDEEDQAAGTGTANTANTWTDNTHRTASPPGLG